MSKPYVFDIKCKDFSSTIDEYMIKKEKIKMKYFTNKYNGQYKWRPSKVYNSKKKENIKDDTKINSFVREIPEPLFSMFSEGTMLSSNISKQFNKNVKKWVDDTYPKLNKISEIESWGAWRWLWTSCFKNIDSNIEGYGVPKIFRGKLDYYKLDYMKKKMVKYTKGGFMTRHSDAKTSYAEEARILCIFPKNMSHNKNINSYHEGGDLIIYPKDREPITVTASEEEDVYKFVILPFGVEHEVKPVTEGTRYIIKFNLFFPEYVQKILNMSSEKTWKKDVTIKHTYNKDEKNIQKLLDEGETVPIILSRIYDVEFRDFDMSLLRRNNFRYISGILKNNDLKYSIANDIVPVDSYDGSYYCMHNTYIKEFMRSEGYDSDFDYSSDHDFNNDYCDYCDENYDRTPLKSTSKIMKEKLAKLLGKDDVFMVNEKYNGRAVRIDNNGGYNDEYTTFLDHYKISVLYIKKC